MTWDLAYCFIYGGAALGASNIFCTAPDVLRKIALLLAMLGFIALYSYHCAGYLGHLPHWEIRDLGQQFIVWGAIIEIARLLFIERLSCKNLSGESLRFPA